MVDETAVDAEHGLDVRGVGFTYDRFYFVKSVTHRIRIGEYRQQFTLTRKGLGAISLIVVMGNKPSDWGSAIVTPAIIGGEI